MEVEITAGCQLGSVVPLAPLDPQKPLVENDAWRSRLEVEGRLKSSEIRTSGQGITKGLKVFDLEEIRQRRDCTIENQFPGHSVLKGAGCSLLQGGSNGLPLPRRVYSLSL
jgi:hypothetical protein